ncbi:MAG TPA: ATP-binding cassette domain-containing protein [Acidimicrobiales bacterium]|nr:ATP-binding cassette domain-containing protein [Acidimicrobiales bacterium]
MTAGTLWPELTNRKPIFMVLTSPTPPTTAAGTAAAPPVAGPQAAPLLEAVGLSKRFGELQVLDAASLRVGPGEVVALVGDNGAGKSTLVKCIAAAVRPDAGVVRMRGRPLGPGHDDVLRAGIGVVWQDLSLCDNLDTVANLFLGRERRRLLLSDTAMQREARRMLDRVGIDVPDLTRPVASLSGGQRQAVAVTRALEDDPALLVLDEPTAALGRAESAQVLALVRALRARGTAVLLVTHDLDGVFDLADRIVVLRQGRVVADVSPREVHPDDVVALQSGLEIDTTASRQLRRLGSLIEQLSEVEPTASLPLVVSAMAAALGQEQLCVHLLDTAGAGTVLRRSAAVGLPEPLLAATAELPPGPAGGPVGLAAATGSVVVSDDLRLDRAWAGLAARAAEAGVLSAWAAPIQGASGVLGTISGYGASVGHPRDDQLELITLYAGHAAASIERERMFAESRRRNRVLEAIRSVLEVLAGPEQVHAGLDAALAALCEVLGAEHATVRVATGGDPPVTRAAAGSPAAAARAEAGLEALADRVLAGAGRVPTLVATADGGSVLAVPFGAPGGRAALAVRWADRTHAEGAAEVLGDVARSLSLALERAEAEAAHRETQALRRSQRLQQAFLSRLSHELRTPLTTIHGCADTLRQPDVEWAPDAQRRFLDTIAAESDRMRRLVADLLDVSAIDAGILRVHPDWCDLRLVVEASVACATGGDAERVAVDVDPALGPVWADHDRLEQVFVNLVENALRHAGGARVRVTAGPAAGGRSVAIRVSDDGPGIPPDLAATLFEPHVSRGDRGGHGLGLAIARGIAAAHGGALVLEPAAAGTTFLVSLPAGGEARAVDG